MRWQTALGIIALGAPLLSGGCASTMSGSGVVGIGDSGPQFVKLCETTNGRTLCTTQHEQFEGVSGGLIVSAAIQQRDRKPGERLVVTVPSGAILPPGMRLKIDDNAPFSLKFTSCAARTCSAEMDATPELLGQMRNGQRLLVATINIALNKPLGMVVPLAGFGPAHDGPPMDSEKYAAARRVAVPGAAVKIRLPEPPHNWHWDWSQHAGTAASAAWVKFCDRTAATSSVCLTHHEQIESGGMASVALRRVQGHAGEHLMAMTPIDVALEPGARLKLGSGEPIKMDFMFCKGVGCFAEITMTPDLMKRLRGERSMTVAAIGMSGKTVRFQVPLSGFVKADDGPAMSIESYRLVRKTLIEMALKEMIVKKIEEQKPHSPVPFASRPEPI